MELQLSEYRKGGWFCVKTGTFRSMEVVKKYFIVRMKLKEGDIYIFINCMS